MHHDWPSENAIVDLPIKMNGNSKRSCGNLLSLLGAQNKNISAASTLLTEVILHLRLRLHVVQHKISLLVWSSLAWPQTNLNSG